jgi:hypothetical protein
MHILYWHVSVVLPSCLMCNTRLRYPWITWSLRWFLQSCFTCPLHVILRFAMAQFLLNCVSCTPAVCHRYGFSSLLSNYKIFVYNFIHVTGVSSGYRTAIQSNWHHEYIMFWQVLITYYCLIKCTLVTDTSNSYTDLPTGSPTIWVTSSSVGAGKTGNRVYRWKWSIHDPSSFVRCYSKPRGCLTMSVSTRLCQRVSHLLFPTDQILFSSMMGPRVVSVTVFYHFECMHQHNYFVP